MANIFKNAHAADIDTNYIDLYTASGVTTVILGLALSNKSNATILVDVQFYDGGTTNVRKLLHQVEIPVGTTLEVLSGQKYILEDTDKLQVKCDVTDGMDAFLSVMEVS